MHTHAGKNLLNVDTNAVIKHWYSTNHISIECYYCKLVEVRMKCGCMYAIVCSLMSKTHADNYIICVVQCTMHIHAFFLLMSVIFIVHRIACLERTILIYFKLAVRNKYSAIAVYVLHTSKHQIEQRISFKCQQSIKLDKLFALALSSFNGGFDNFSQT